MCCLLPVGVSPGAIAGGSRRNEDEASFLGPVFQYYCVPVSTPFTFAPRIGLPVPSAAEMCAEPVMGVVLLLLTGSASFSAGQSN